MCIRDRPSSDHVNDDDVDVAISVMLESFINSQKHAVKMALQRAFRAYMVRPEDDFGLLLYQLKELVREQLEVMNILDNASSDETLTVKVQLEEFEERAQQVGVSNVLPFLQSALFKDNKFRFDVANKVILREFQNTTDAE